MNAERAAHAKTARELTYLLDAVQRVGDAIFWDEEEDERTEAIGELNAVMQRLRPVQPPADDAGQRCAVCGKPATCIGAYEGTTEKSPACDDCCGHGNEDGHCKPIDDAGQEGET